jgi:hypothetical protein
MFNLSLKRVIYHTQRELYISFFDLGSDQTPRQPICHYPFKAIAELLTLLFVKKDACLCCTMQR